MKGHHVPAIGRPPPLRGFAGDGDLVIAVARLIADHGAGPSLARQAVAHSVARGFAFDRKLKLPATAGGMACQCSGSMIEWDVLRIRAGWPVSRRNTIRSAARARR